MKNLILILTLLSTLSACGQHGNRHSHAHNNESKQLNVANENSGTLENIPAVAFKKVHEATIPFPVEKVFPLFEPQGRYLLYSKWNPTILRKGEKGSLKGQIEFSKYSDLDVILTVRDYNPEEGYIQYLVIWDDFEIQRIDIICKPGEKENTTNMTWIEHNAGLYEKGEYLVSKFVKEGYLDNAVERYVNNIKKKLSSDK